MSDLAGQSALEPAGARVLAPVDFYFDFSSPYAYFSAEQIDALGARYGRNVNWHPILLGAAFKATGATLPVRQPLKGDYMLTDFARSARFHAVPFVQPMDFPVSTQHAARAFLWLSESDVVAAKGFAHAVFRAYFTAGRNIDNVDTVLDIAASLGIARPGLAEALVSVALKDRLRMTVDRALARGVFGVPFFIVEGQRFWGMDRLPQLERWLTEGGF